MYKLGQIVGTVMFALILAVDSFKRRRRGESVGYWQLWALVGATTGLLGAMIYVVVVVVVTRRRAKAQTADAFSPAEYDSAGFDAESGQEVIVPPEWSDQDK